MTMNSLWGCPLIWKLVQEVVLWLQRVRWENRLYPFNWILCYQTETSILQVSNYLASIKQLSLYQYIYPRAMETPKKPDSLMQDTVCPNCRYRFKTTKRVESHKAVDSNNDQTTKKDTKQILKTTQGATQKSSPIKARQRVQSHGSPVRNQKQPKGSTGSEVLKLSTQQPKQISLNKDQSSLLSGPQQQESPNFKFQHVDQPKDNESFIPRLILDSSAQRSQLLSSQSRRAREQHEESSKSSNILPSSGVSQIDIPARSIFQSFQYCSIRQTTSFYHQNVAKIRIVHSDAPLYKEESSGKNEYQGRRKSLRSATQQLDQLERLQNKQIVISLREHYKRQPLALNCLPSFLKSMLLGCRQ